MSKEPHVSLKGFTEDQSKMLVAVAGSVGIARKIITNLIKLNNMTQEEKIAKRNAQMKTIAGQGYIRPTGMVIEEAIEPKVKVETATIPTPKVIKPTPITIINPIVPEVEVKPAPVFVPEIIKP